MIHLRAKHHNDAKVECVPHARGVWIVVSDESDRDLHITLSIDRATLEGLLKQSTFQAWRLEWEAKLFQPVEEVGGKDGAK